MILVKYAVGRTGTIQRLLAHEYRCNVVAVEVGSWTDSDSSGFPDEGEHIIYTIAVTNEGTVTLRNIQLTDTSGDVTCEDTASSTLLGWGGAYECTASRQAREGERRATSILSYLRLLLVTSSLPLLSYLAFDIDILLSTQWEEQKRLHYGAIPKRSYFTRVQRRNSTMCDSFKFGAQFAQGIYTFDHISH